MDQGNSVETTANLYAIAYEMKAIAKEGLRHPTNEYNDRRYREIGKLSSQILDIVDGENTIELRHDFTDNSEIVTPLAGVDAAVILDGKILLIKRSDNHLWALPGGGVDVGDTLREAVLRELKEETGLDGIVKRLLGIFDSRIWKCQLKFHAYLSIFEVNVTNNSPVTTVESLDWGYFGENELPPLSPGHDLRIPLLFKLLRGEIAAPYLD